MITRDEFGNPLYTGFIPELIFKLSRRLRFDYRFREAFAYGKFDNTTQQWTGMIGEVIKNEVSMVAESSVIWVGDLVQSRSLFGFNVLSFLFKFSAFK